MAAVTKLSSAPPLVMPFGPILDRNDEYIGIKLRKLMSALGTARQDGLSASLRSDNEYILRLSNQSKDLANMSDADFTKCIQRISNVSHAITPRGSCFSQCRSKTCLVAKRILKTIVYTGVAAAIGTIGLYTYNNWNEPQMQNLVKASVNLFDAVKPLFSNCFETVSNFAQRAFSLMW